MKRTKSRALAILAILLIGTLSGWAQFAQRGGVEGFVFDSTGAVVPGAAVTLVSLDQAQTLTEKTREDGSFQFNDLVAGEYRLTAQLAGFATANSGSLTVTIGGRTHFEFRLKPGSTGESVEVTSSSPALDTDRASVGEAISARQLEDLPLNGRNFTSLAALLPGVSTIPQANINPYGTFQVGSNFASGGVAYTAGGVIQGSRDNGFYINGVNINENYVSGTSYQPSPEALQEANIHVADFSAAAGHDLTTLSLQTKGGATSFHGHVYDYLENDALNALNPADKAYAIINQSPVSKPSLRRNQFGGGIGGPVFIPRLWPDRKRFFFFANYEKFIEADGKQPNYTSVPSDAERTGDFSELLTGSTPYQLYNPFFTQYNPDGSYSRPAIANNRLDQAVRADGSPLIDPLSAKILNLYPHANLAGPSYTPNYFAYSTSGFSDYHFDSRFDYHISDKNSVFVTYSKANGQQNNGGGIFPELITNNSDNAMLVTVNDAHAFSAALVN